MASTALVSVVLLPLYSAPSRGTEARESWSFCRKEAGRGVVGRCSARLWWLKEDEERQRMFVRSQRCASKEFVA